MKKREKLKGLTRTLQTKKQPKIKESFLKHLFVFLIIWLGILIFIYAFQNIGRSEPQERRNLKGELRTTSPIQNLVQMTPKTSKTFSIDMQGYEEINWYLDDNLVSQGVATYNFAAKMGNHTIRVNMKNNTRIESRIWRVVVENRGVIEKPLPKQGSFVFYLIVSITVVMMSLIIWLFIIEKNKQNRGSYSFVSRTRTREMTNKEAKKEESDEFNIPS
jgi:hypothetical protein